MATAQLDPTAPVAGARRRRLTGPLATAGAVLGATLVLIPFDPNTEHVPICPLKATTGLDCPACGGLRCVHDLATGQVAQAANQNVLLLAYLPLAVALWLVWTVRRWRGDPRPVRVHPRVLVALAVIALVFGIVRNLPFVPYLRSGPN